MRKLPVVAILIIITLSCQEKTAHTPILQEEQTPATLDEDKSTYDISSVSKRYDSDIIQELYEEAILQNPALKKLDERLNEIHKIKNDSLEAYEKYLQNNSRYWASVSNYINQLSDSTSKKEMREIFKALQAKYETRISKHKLALEELEAKTKILQDRQLLMLLVVTEPMMNNYQRNELPDIKTIQTLTSQYDSLILDTKRFSEFKK